MSVGSNPTQGVDLSEAVQVTDVGDGGGGAVLCAVGVGGSKFCCIMWWNFKF